jgi:hypothetical protein
MSNLTVLKDLGIVTVKAAIIATLLFALTTMLITQAHAGIAQGDSRVDPVTTAAGPLNNAPGSDARPDKGKTLEIVVHTPKTVKVHIANKHDNSFDLVPNVGETE